MPEIRGPPPWKVTGDLDPDQQAPYPQPNDVRASARADTAIQILNRICGEWKQTWDKITASTPVNKTELFKLYECIEGFCYNKKYTWMIQNDYTKVILGGGSGKGMLLMQARTAFILLVQGIWESVKIHCPEEIIASQNYFDSVVQIPEESQTYETQQAEGSGTQHMTAEAYTAPQPPNPTPAEIAANKAYEELFESLIEIPEDDTG
ncbi:hypothetical protein BDV96DRAFT_598632 [Lophiotrema nucula]|uniref:Uncharacterized protein n=1 Tax=Lophiotrema nucula TaxID=690887 RepID=A0A6A5ZE96_9PLEO|nr:hypothetical protein BDV96DRAFT_598632 [Lophiotrema nucula]